ncbi:hypothetical protein L228DRAFT_266800 [Xylona heveae TC161]|uniref:Fork-head domain-containing protein n=1 Tax=Xylona heveae (strain CBS 132557 / TC161) TaxID=1328760 RepID=A0A161TET7_XYLHT|nr:hypothetical protein L228DRAFT_266800 [Xylona heveae TC161]KZF24467.1 hypothetical protein L228DRAFT_266800 [Xylona heveae TC161]
MSYPSISLGLQSASGYLFGDELSSHSFIDPNSYYATIPAHGQYMGTPPWPPGYGCVPRSVEGIDSSHDGTLDSAIRRPLELLTERYPDFACSPELPYQQSQMFFEPRTIMEGTHLERGRAAFENLQIEEPKDDQYLLGSPEEFRSRSCLDKNDSLPQMGLTPLDQGERNPLDGGEENESDGAATSNDTPYAQLIFRALMETQGHRMVLTDIYDWFEKNTDKAKSTTCKSKTGWKNSIRHNLSMNPAFRKEPLKEPFSDGKKRYIWCLDQHAIDKGQVSPTTRFRKHVATKKATRSGHPSPRRQRPGHKGGKSALTAAKQRRPVNKRERAQENRKNDRADEHAFIYPESNLSALVSSFHSPQLVQDPLHGNIRDSDFKLPSRRPVHHRKPETPPYGLDDIVGCTPTLPEEPLFYDSPDTATRSCSAEYDLRGLSPGSSFLRLFD